MAKGARPEQPADAGREQDVLVLTAYYSEHKPELASREKVEQVIASFQRKARAAATASVNSIGPSWRELMYDSITKRSGVDPREYWDLAVASEVASSAAQRQRQRTEAAVATRRLAWEEDERRAAGREVSLSERKSQGASREAKLEKEYLEKPWRRDTPQTVTVTVKPDGYEGQRMTIKLPSGATIYPVVPPNVPPGQTFTWPAIPQKPPIASIGGGHRVKADAGREPFAKQFEVVQEALDPAHPSMPHIDHWQEPQYNDAKPGGAAESEYQDRYLGFWREDAELNDGKFFARLPEKWKEPEDKHKKLQGEHGSKRAEMSRILDGSHGTLAGPHADMMLQDSISANIDADERHAFKNRPASMLKSKGAAAGVKLLKRYVVVTGGTGGQGCELQICSGDLTRCCMDALVTPANSNLAPGGMGVNARVHSAAGRVFNRIVARVPETSPGLRCEPGCAVATPSGDLAVAWVIHAVCPVHPSAPRWQQLVYAGKQARSTPAARLARARNPSIPGPDPPLGVPNNYRNYKEEDVKALLGGAYTAALQLANEHKLRTISAPALSCDVGGYPHAEAAQVALDTCLKRNNIGELELIQFVLTDEYQERAWLKEAARQVRFGVLAAAPHGADPRTGEQPQEGEAGGGGDVLEERAVSEQQEQLLKAFRAFDVNGDGNISPAEFRQGLNRMDIELPKQRLLAMMEKLASQKLDAVWGEIDRDGSGDVDASELQSLLERMGHTMSADHVARLAARLDKDHDGTISKTELQKWWSRQPASEKENVISINYREFAMKFDPTEHALRRLFNDIDEDGGGTLDADEIWRLCRDMGAELDARELKEAMREMDADGSGEVDFEEFHGWMGRARKHSRKLAAAVSDFRAKRSQGAVREERPFGRPAGGRAGDATFQRARDGYLPHRISRKEQPSSMAVAQLDQPYYDRQQHAGVLLGDPPVTVKPGQQAGAGTRESHYQGPRDKPDDKTKRDPNGYVPYRPHEEIIAAVMDKVASGWRQGKKARLRRELEGLSVKALRDKALGVGIDRGMVSRWYEGVGKQTQSTVARNVNEDDHYTLVPHWEDAKDDGEGYREAAQEKKGHLERTSNTRVGRYIGLLKEKEDVSAKEDLAGLRERADTVHTWIDPRSCWVGGIPRKHASERAMRKVLEDHGMATVHIAVRVKNRIASMRGAVTAANRSWALVEFVDEATAQRARKAKVMVDDDQGRPSALKIREARVEEKLAQQQANLEETNAKKQSELIEEEAEKAEGAMERVTVAFPLNEGGFGSGSMWEKGRRDPDAVQQGRQSYPLTDGTEEPLTTGKWEGGSTHFVARKETPGALGSTAMAGGVSKQTDKWGNPIYEAPNRPKAKSDVHDQIIGAIVAKSSAPPERKAKLRKELGNLRVPELRERAIAGGVDMSMVDKWWAIVGEKMESSVVKDARHLQVHWGKRYVGRNPDEPFSGWGAMRDRLKYS